jgi:hypothetical protein
MAMRFLIRSLWKCLPKQERSFLLERLPVHQRQAVNKVLSGNIRLLPGFQEHSCIFIHIPKCAGESISQALFQGSGPGHMSMSYYERVHPEFYNKAFKFSFVRDPIERTYSAYRYLQSDRGIARDHEAHKLISQYPEFNSFVNGWLCPENACTQIHFVPQWLFLCNSVGNLDVDFIGHHEHLEVGFEKVCQVLEIKTALGHKNRSKKAESSARELCDEDALRRIYQVYRRDYELFDYPQPI